MDDGFHGRKVWGGVSWLAILNTRCQERITMLPGPTILRRCSQCAHIIHQRSTMSGNTLGATLWTDGRVDAPMLPDSPWLVACRSCHALLWVDELDMVGAIGPGEYCDQFPLPGVFVPRNDAVIRIFGDKNVGGNAWAPLGFDDYMRVLESGVTDPAKVKYLRTKALWAGNDRRRNSTSIIPHSEEEVDNIRHLIDGLDESDCDELIMKAELYRELHRWDDALCLLKSKPTIKKRPVVKTLIGLCKAKNSAVVPIESF